MKQISFLPQIIFVILFLCLTFNAQTTETKKVQTAAEEQKETEVRKFVASFIKEMDEKKDIRNVSESFFTLEFKKRFTTLVVFYNHLPKELTEVERYQASAEIFNLMYQGLMCMYGNGIDSDSLSDDGIEMTLKKFLPEDIVKMLKSNYFLKMIVEDKIDYLDDKEFEDITKIKQLISDLHNINTAFTTLIESKPPQWHETYQKKSNETRTEMDYYNASICKDDDGCKGLAKNTTIYHHDSSPFCIEIVEEAGSYKILNIYLRMD